MICNIGKADRILRLSLGLILLLVGLILQTWWGLLALPLIATALMRFCPAYLPFKFQSK
jgi:hypothetical protein